MRKLKIFIILAGVALLLVFSFFIWYHIMSYGTPWGREQALKQVQEYLDETYTQKMTVNNVSYQLHQDTYLVSASPESNRNINFLVFINKKDHAWHVWKDQYYIEYFSYGLGAPADKYAKELFGEESRAYASIDGETIKIYGIHGLNENTRLEDVIDVFSDKYHIGVCIYRELNLSDYDKDAEDMLLFINYVNSLKCKPNKVSFSYYEEGSYSSYFRYTLKKEEYQNITVVNDLLPYIQEAQETLEK